MLQLEHNANITDVLSSNPAFVSACSTIKASLKLLRDSKNEVKDGLPSARAELFEKLQEAVSPNYRSALLDAQLFVSTLNNTLSFHIGVKRNGGMLALFTVSMAISITDGKVSFHKASRSSAMDIEEQFGQYEHVAILCSDIPVKLFAGAALMCEALVDASANTGTDLSNVLHDYVAIEYGLTATESQLHRLCEDYGHIALKSFTSCHERVTAADIKALWDAPAGTVLHFLTLSAKSVHPYSIEPKLIIWPSPNSIWVEGEGAERKLVYCRKSGHGGTMGSALPKLTVALQNGTFIADETPMFYQSLRCVSDAGFDAIRQCGNPVMKL